MANINLNLKKSYLYLNSIHYWRIIAIDGKFTWEAQEVPKATLLHRRLLLDVVKSLLKYWYVEELELL